MIDLLKAIAYLGGFLFGLMVIMAFIFVVVFFAIAIYKWINESMDKTDIDPWEY